MKKIAIFQSDLRVGGIQKSLLNMLNEIDYTKCEIDVFVFDRAHFFDVSEHENLNFIFLKPYAWLSRLVYFGILLRFFPIDASISSGGKKYDTAIDFNSYRSECAIGAILSNAKKCVMWIHNDVEVKKRNEIKYRILWHFFKSKLKRFDEFAAVSPGIIEGFRRASGIFDKDITAIPNYVDTEEIFHKALEPVDFRIDTNCYNLCSMGRLCHQKGFDIMIDIIAQAVSRRPDVRLYIIGDGPDKDKLMKKIKRLNLENEIELLGNLKNPFPYLDKMDGFILTSRYEGQGIVVREAQALGLEIFIPERLEKYNPGVAGTSDLVEAIFQAERREKKRDNLENYNRKIKDSIARVLGI
ncbi:MAG: glycosyltransferase [Oscillospiraceae bacterium]|nr:glycosyltransferase [Oscillospiraceae bacterium]